jgi:hypothetical protein
VPREKPFSLAPEGGHSYPPSRLHSRADKSVRAPGFGSAASGGRTLLSAQILYHTQTKTFGELEENLKEVIELCH